MTSTGFELADRLSATSGTVAMSGNQALLRVVLDQRRADAAAGVRTGALVAGYRGSPLTGIEAAYERDRTLLDAHEIRFVSGVNEDLAATMIWGSQAAHLEPDCRYDGVLGLWYGKGPGLDRSMDALRHANLSGIGPHGGVVAAVGDDPACKSSTVPSASEGLLANLGMPAFYPGSVQEVLDLGRWAYELSRYCGLWVGMKVHTDVADQYATVDVDPARLGAVRRPDRGSWLPKQATTLMPAVSLELEVDEFGPRLEAAEAFVAANGLDATVVGAERPRLGIIAPGKLYADVRDALGRLGLADADALGAAGVAVYKPAMIWPLASRQLGRFAAAADEVLVVEEKRPFVESQVRDLLFAAERRPRVTGKHDDRGAPLIPGSGALTTDALVQPLADRLEVVVPDVELDRPRRRVAAAIPVDATRSPYFCSGCPHNRSTVVPDGSVAGAGIGCHAMAAWMDRSTVGLTHMGGEGAQWAGMAPFLGDPHRFQNLGDGTFFHSGSLAIRQAVSAGTTITYKILYNGTVAMTGGQDAAGSLPVPDLTRLLEAEGVVRTVVMTDDPDRYGRSATWAPNARVEHRDCLDAVQRELREVDGVTVIVYDQRCAAELRRDRKGGRAAIPTRRIVINEAVCDGCGDCGRISNCMSVQPVVTALGRKTRIHQESCNFDYTCVQGNCPAFIEVVVDPDEAQAIDGGGTSWSDAVPPEPAIPAEASVLIVGIGGTGVVTVNQILATAALIDGKQAVSLDQTGLAQKGGQVISNLRIGAEMSANAARVGRGEADVALVFDAVGGAAPDIVERCAPDRTRAVVSSVLAPTGTMVRDVRTPTPDLAAFRSVIDSATRSEGNVWLNAEGIARAAFSNQPAANMIVVGVAHQAGWLPVSAGAIESAIAQNGVSVDMNVAAFRLGRRLRDDPELAAQLVTPDQLTAPPQLSGVAAALLGTVETDEALSDVLRWRIPELIAHSDEAHAARYCGVVAAVRQAELKAGADQSRLSQTVACQLFKLMAYKDEYEVARLHLDPELGDRIRRTFGQGATFSYVLEPPTLKKLGRTGKIRVPEKLGRAMFASLRRAKRLRGSRFDLFGMTEERRLERQLIDEYRALVDDVIASLDATNVEAAAGVLGLADQIRGFDAVKADNVARYRREVATALEEYLG